MGKIVGKVYEDAEVDISTKSKKELLEMAAEANLPATDKMTKSELIELIESIGDQDEG